MNKLLIPTLFLLAGCSTHFSINGTMCDQIANDPLATIPAECRNYSEEKATKASKAPIEILDKKDMIEFKGEE